MTENLKKGQLIRMFAIFLCLAALTVGLEVKSLWPPDEQREAAISRGQAENRNYILIIGKVER